MTKLVIYINSYTEFTVEETVAIRNLASTTDDEIKFKEYVPTTPRVDKPITYVMDGYGGTCILDIGDVEACGGFKKLQIRSYIREKKPVTPDSFKPREGNTVINNKCDVAVSNALLDINEVMLLEDHCTDMLREEINNGWKILAICVQPDQRRPDYIMGRHVDKS